MLDEFKQALQKDKHFDAMKSEYESLKNKMADYKAKDLINHHDEVKEILEEEIVSRYYYQKGRIEADFKYDADVRKALEVLGNQGLFASILRGDGSYKVIGKPGSPDHARADKEREEDEQERN